MQRHKTEQRIRSAPYCSFRLWNSCSRGVVGSWPVERVSGGKEAASEPPEQVQIRK